MKLGKVSQSVSQRSILKQIHTDNDAALTKISQNECCVGVRAAEEELVISAEASLYGDEKDLCVFAIAQAVNHLAIKGASAKGISITLLLPEFAYESRIKSMVAYAQEMAERLDVPILRADAEIVSKISTTIVHVTVTGTVMRSSYENPKPRAGQELVMVGYMGLAGSLRIKRAKEEELAQRFIPAFLDRLEDDKSYLLAEEALKLTERFGRLAMCQVTEGGIMAALWNLAESAGAGLSADMRKIPVKQETIEVCECFQFNPYQLTSIGAVLIATDHGEELIELFEKEGIPAALIGRLTEGNDRVIYSGGEMRYLDKPAADELVKIL